MRRKPLTDWIAGLLILLFAYTAVNKLATPLKFRIAMQASPLIGEKAYFLAWAIPVIELLIVFLLFIPRLRKWGFYFSFLLMALFTGYVGYMLATQSHLPCSCGGVIQLMTWKQHLWFNIFFTALSGIGIWLGRKETQEQSIKAYKEIIAQ